MPSKEPRLLAWTRAFDGFGAMMLLQAIYLTGALVSAPVETSAQNTPPSQPPALSFSLAPPKQKGGTYVGDETCAGCHQDKAISYHKTAHAITSSHPSQSSIGGSFDSGLNILRTVNPDLYFEMEANEKGFFQTAKARLPDSRTLFRTERIDVVIGSGRKGQTYLFWDGDQLFELPVSYWTEGRKWVNSPSYPDGTASFERPVHPRCLECHVSNFASQAPPVNSFNKPSLVLGLACEKCHGPGSEHVARFRSNPLPSPSPASGIINPAKLSRERQIEVCKLCHAGIGTSLTPPLTFVPGASLAKHLVFEKAKPGARIDAHSGQIQLLERSKCYQSSPTMTCATCHDVHQPQRDLAAFATKCLTCHQVESCRNFPVLGHKIDRQCITCHMPAETTDQIISSANGLSMQPKVRNHQIGIYPDAVIP